MVTIQKLRTFIIRSCFNYTIIIYKMLKFPGLSRINNLLLFIVLASVVLYLGREFFILIAFSGLFAMLMTPVCEWLERHGISKTISSLLSILILLLFISGVVFILSAQIRSLAHDLPAIIQKGQDLLANVKAWLNDQFNINLDQQSDNVLKNASQAVSKAGGILAGIVGKTFKFLGSLLLVLVFTFLFLINRVKYRDFLVSLQKPDKRSQMESTLTRVTQVAHKYLEGRLVAIIIIGILMLAGFIITGLRNAILLAAITALFAFIPYIGPLIGGLLPFFLAVVDGSLSQGLGVIIVVLVVNGIDHYFIEPYIVGGSVNISSFFTFLVLIIGGVIWGVAGIILSVPILGILKVIFENVEGLKPYAQLIGDDENSTAHKSLITKLGKFILRRGGRKGDGRQNKSK